MACEYGPIAAAASVVRIGSASVPTDSGHYAALVTLLERIQRVQTLMRLTPPLTRARTDWMFAWNRRRVTLWAWLTLRPTAGPFPQISQRLAIGTPDCVLVETMSITSAHPGWRASGQRPGTMRPDTRSLSARCGASPSEPSEDGEVAAGSRNTRFSRSR